MGLISLHIVIITIENILSRFHLPHGQVYKDITNLWLSYKVEVVRLHVVTTRRDFAFYMKILEGQPHISRH